MRRGESLGVSGMGQTLMSMLCGGAGDAHHARQHPTAFGDPLHRGRQDRTYLCILVRQLVMKDVCMPLDPLK